MITKKVISVEESIEFFNTSINTLETAIGVCVIDIKNKRITYEQSALDIINDDKLFAGKEYPFSDEKLDSSYVKFLEKILASEIKENTEYNYSFNEQELNIKLELLNKNELKLYIIDIEKLLETEKELTLLNNILESGDPIYTVCTWWIDYDRYNDRFYQTSSGPKLLGIPVSEDGIYITSEFAEVREKAARKTEFYEECIRAEQQMFDKTWNNETDYFGGRTPAFTKDDREVWVESYGKCIIRYPDGRPRMFIAIDIYLSDILENSNQVSLLNSLIDKGLINSEVGVWYYQKYYNEGKYYFTNSYKKIMRTEDSISNENISSKLTERFAKIIEHTAELESYLVNFRTTHNTIFTGEIDNYRVVVPNHTDKNAPQWVDIRGTVIERDEEGHVKLFIGVNVDVTETVSRNLELERLRIENEHLHLAEKLAIKAGSVLVWYHDLTMDGSKYLIFGNDTFVKRLGITRNKEGFLNLKVLRNSISKKTAKDRERATKFIKNLNDLYSGKTDFMKDNLVKHFNLTTGEEMYLEHTVEVEDKFEDGSIKLVGGFMRDVTENVKKQEKISYLANNDVLTGLRNRNYFDNFLKSNKLPNSYTVLLFDLDGLKLINDAFGHIDGDKVIQLVAKFLKEIFKDSLIIARIGGDEFVVITEDISPDSVTDNANKLEAFIEEYNKTSTIELNVSKGGKVVIDNEVSFERAFILAENLMYRRKLGNRSSRKSKVLDSILETLSAKTEETKEHSERIGEVCVKIMESMGMSRASEIDDMVLLARVHDVGKVTIPDNILNKPGKLTYDEYEVIKKHSEAGYKIIKNITDSDFVSEAVLGHHERWDGTGYPQGLKGDNIPIFARIISVADSFDAMTNTRIYQKEKTQQEAIEEIKRCSGTQFDPTVVEAFLKIYIK